MQTFGTFVCKWAGSGKDSDVEERCSFMGSCGSRKREAVSGVGDALYDYGESVGCNIVLIDF